jgi:hypothetical protein
LRAPLVKRKHVRTGGHRDVAGTVDQAHGEIVAVVAAEIAVVAVEIVVVTVVVAASAADRSNTDGKTAY